MKENIQKILSDLTEALLDPAIIIAPNGNIASANKTAISLLEISKDDKNLFDILSSDSAEGLNKLLDDISNTSGITESSINFVLRSGKEFIISIRSTDFFAGDKKLYFILLHENINTLPEEQPLKLESQPVMDLNLDETKLNLLEEIKQLLPLTFVGKEKAKYLLSKVNFPVWIKSNDGILLAVNSSFAERFSIQPASAEGKKESEFLPIYLAAIKNASKDYIVSSNNAIIITGFPLGVKIKNERIIELPVLNKGKTLAIIGFTDTVAVERDVQKNSGDFINHFPKPVAIIDENGFLINANSEFKSLTGERLVTQKNISEIFPEKIHNQIFGFLTSDEDKLSFDINDDIWNTHQKSFNFFLNKNRVSHTNEIIIFIEIKNKHGELENLIKNRGRMFDILIQNNPEPIFIYDKENLSFLEVNNAALEIYGYRRDEFLKMDLTDLYSPEDIQTLLHSSNANHKEGFFYGPYRHKKKDGKVVNVEISKVSFQYEGHDAHFNIIRDISAKLELQKKEQLFNAVFENSSDLLFITDANGFINFTNDQVTKKLGYSSDELQGTTLPSLVRNEDRGSVNSSIFQSKQKITFTLNTDFKHKNGSQIKAELNAVPILNPQGDIESFHAIVKLDDVKIKEIIKEVIKEVPVYSSPEPETNLSSHKENEKNNAVFSSVFHEILTPINVILGFVNELTESLPSLTPEQQESADIIEENRKRLLASMNAIMEYTNIERKNIELSKEEIAITDVIDHLSDDVHNKLASFEKEISYGRISSSLSFNSDREQFYNLMQLLLSIIFQLTPEKKLFLSAVPINDESFVITFKDSYSASSQKFVKELSNLFLKDDSEIERMYGISKLTVQLTKSLLKLLGGSFEIFPAGEKKSEYGFVFPFVLEEKIAGATKETLAGIKFYENANKESAEDENESRDFDFMDSGLAQKEHEDSAKNIPSLLGRNDLSQLSCLYIEDQVDSQILFKVQMKDLKEIKYAVSFEEALPLLDNSRFDFIVMDINLQGEYNGLDALKIIHKMPGLEKIPIIAVTAYVLPGDREKFIAAGFDDFISKPIFREKMLDSLDKIFSMQM